jgi:hypothetical protein
MYRKLDSFKKKKEITKVIPPPPPPKKSKWRNDGCDKSKVDINFLKQLQHLDVKKKFFKYPRYYESVVHLDCGTEQGQKLREYTKIHNIGGMKRGFDDGYDCAFKRINFLKEDVDHYLKDLENHTNYWVEEYEKQPVFTINPKTLKGIIDFGSGNICMFIDAELNMFTTEYTIHSGRIKTKIKGDYIELLGIYPKSFDKLSIMTKFYQGSPKKEVIADLGQNTLFLLGMIEGIPSNVTYDLVYECVNHYVLTLSRSISLQSSPWSIWGKCKKIKNEE